MTFTAEKIALFLGLLALALILGALGSQYMGHLVPCEMCLWQRWPHIAAAIVGIGGGGLIMLGALPRQLAVPVAIVTILLVAASGALGVFHAGVEWKFWQGPQACTGNAFNGPLNLNAPVIRCDVAQWRLLGISLAGYNAIVSLGAAIFAAYALLRRKA